MGQKKWRLIIYESVDPHVNMALEEAMARTVGAGFSRNTVRLWRNSNTIVLGCFQSVDLEIDPALYGVLKTKLVRRFTGGGAVYQDLGNLNFSLAVKTPNPLIHDDICITMKKMVKWIVKGLEKFGIDAIHEIKNGIIVEDKKISGLSASRRWGSFFLHGTLLIDTDVHLIQKILTPREDVHKSFIKATKSKRRKVTNLVSEVGKRIDIKDLLQVLKKTFEKTYQIELLKGEFSYQEWALASQLYHQKYSLIEWNFKK